MIKSLFFLIFVPFLLNAASPLKLHPVKKRRYAIGQILSFSIPQEIAPALIDETAHGIYIVVHAGDNVTSVAPTITCTPGFTVNPASGVPQNFSSPIAYGVYDVNGVRSSYYSVNVFTTRVVPAGCSSASTTIPGDPMPGGAPVLSIQWQMLVGGAWLPATGQNDQADYQTPTYTNNTGSPVRYTFRRQLTTSFGAAFDSYSDYTVNPPLSGGNVISQPAGSATTFCGTTDAEFLNGPAPTGGDGTYSYQWQSNTGSGWNNIIPNGNSQGYNAPGSTTAISYRRIITSSSCSPVTSNPITMTVVPIVTPGTITQPTTSTFCVNGSPGFIPETPATGGNGTYTYQWQTQDANGAWVNVTTNGTNETFNPGTITATTTYRRTVASGVCNTPVATGSVTITVIPPVTNYTVTQPATTTFCQTSGAITIQGQDAVAGINPASYQWEFSVDNGNSWQPIAGQTGRDLNAEPAVTQTTWFRRAAYYGTCSNYYSNIVVITIQPPVINTLNPLSQTAYCSSAQPGDLTGPVSGGDGAYTYQWQKSENGGPPVTITGVIGASYNPGTVTVNTTYYRIVTSGACTAPVSSNPISITVDQPATGNSIANPAVTTFCQSGNPGTITGSMPTIPTNGVTYSYQWQTVDATGNGTDITTATGQNLDVGTLTATTTFRRLLITSGACTTPVPSNTVTITIQQKLDNNTIPTNYNFCEKGDPGTITGSTPTGGDDSYTYQWYSSSTLNGTYSPINTATGPNLTPGIISVTTYYKREVTSGACTTPLESNILNVHVTPQLTQSQISATPVQPCVGTDPGYFQEGPALGGDGLSSYTYQWESAPTANGPWTPIAGKTNEQYDPGGLMQTTFFRRIAYSGTCSHVSNVVKLVVKSTPPIVALDPVSPVCPGMQVTFKVTNPDPTLSYIWYDSADLSNAVSPGTSFKVIATSTTPPYYVVANNGSCSSPMATKATVSVIPQPTVPQAQASAGTTSSDPTCIGSDVTLTAGAPNDGLTYNWYTTATGGTAAKPNQQLITITPTTATTVWYVEAVNSTGCNSATRAMVTVYATTPPVVAIHANAVCAGTVATLTADNNDPDVSVYWYDAATGGNNIGSGNSVTTPVITGPTTFYAETRTANCTLETRIPVNVGITQPLQAPVVVFDSATSSSLTFSWGAVTGATAYQFSIDGGQSFSSPTIADNALTQTIDNLQLDQNVTIIVRALGATTCETSANSAPVTGVTKNPLADNIFVANAFTPNGDGRNDIVYVHNENIKSLKFYVYNQYGELLFTSLSQSKGWDGTYKGKLEPIGVYVYYLEAIMNDGKQVNKKGTITLLR